MRNRDADRAQAHLQNLIDALGYFGGELATTASDTPLAPEFRDGLIGLIEATKDAAQKLSAARESAQNTKERPHAQH